MILHASGTERQRDNNFNQIWTFIEDLLISYKSTQLGSPLLLQDTTHNYYSQLLGHTVKKKKSYFQSDNLENDWLWNHALDFGYNLFQI